MLQNSILEMVASGVALDATARAVCLRIETLMPGVTCAISRKALDGRLVSLAGPALPEDYFAADDAANKDARPSGPANDQWAAVEAHDIGNDPRWRDAPDLPPPPGRTSCWSTPILDRNGGLLGAFSLFYKDTVPPGLTDNDMVRTTVHLCAIAMERDRQRTALNRLAYRDLLTGLPNRAAFDGVADRCGPGGPRVCGLLIVDLDNLKSVNDTAGYRAGDALIRTTARRIEESVAPFKAFRLAGDEFAVLLGDGPYTADTVDQLAQRLLTALSEPVDGDGRAAAPRATIGGAFADTPTPLAVLRQWADFALYQAKATERGGYVRYSQGLGATMSRRLDAIRDVEAALAEDRIDAYYQPIVRIDTGEIVGLEALFRLISPSGEILSAGDYFESSSDMASASRLTSRMLAIVAHDVRRWLDQGVWFQHVGINASSADFRGGKLHHAIREAFDREKVPLKHVILEVTESVYMGRDGAGVGQAIQEMRDAGLRVALDDFGTGFASLTHLLSVPVDVIKIDKSFVAQMAPGGRGSVIVEGLLAIAGKLGLRVVAEGVETQAQAQQLREWGCLLAQGFFYSAAVHRDEVTRLLAEKAQTPNAKSLLASQPGGSLLDIPPFDAQGRVRRDGVIRYAVLMCGSDWRVVSERRQFGRFRSRAEAFQCAVGLAREAIASGAPVELLHAGIGGELRSFPLPGNTGLRLTA